jgi:arabinan endo-1,5-alpha-L-arabinosidase
MFKRQPCSWAESFVTMPASEKAMAIASRRNAFTANCCRWVMAVVLFATGFVAGLATIVAVAAPPELLTLSGDLTTHDPAIIKESDTYYLFCTGGNRGQGIVPIRTSPDMRKWTQAGYVFDKLPDWVAKEVPKARNAWAPDVSFYNGKYHLYYSLSSFGVNDSAIGLATNTTLKQDSPDYKWVDEGLVVWSHAGQDDFNAIDPNLAVESDGGVWLTWGSFWGGIKMRRIDPATGKLSADDTTLYSLAARPRQNPHQTPPVEGAIEAPFLFHHGDYWYLFVSHDFCCRGPRSDYKVKVGRSAVVTGPYVDKEDKPMTEGGGSLVVEAATELWHGAGHEAVLRDGDTDYLLFHAYFATANRPPFQLQISTMTWEDGWPEVARLP